MMRIDFHTHTYHSYDSIMQPLKIIEKARKQGLNGIVINDHNTIKGGIETQKANPYSDFEVIVGAEIKTDAGDITGIFLKNEIVSRKFKDVCHEIKEQGGLTILNHPFVGHKLDLVDYSLIDLIEGFNSRLSFQKNQLAVKLARELGKPIIAGSDAHCYSEIGLCYTTYDTRDLLKPVDTVYKRTGYFTIPQSQFIKAYKRRDCKLFVQLLGYTPKIIFKRLVFTDEKN